MDEVLYWKAYAEELVARNEALEAENINLREERDKFRFKLEDVVLDTKEDLWRLRREVDEKLSELVEVLEDYEV